MKKTLVYLLLVMVSVFFITACFSKEKKQPQKQTYTDFIDTGARIAVEAGDVYGDLARNIFKAREAPEYTTVTNMLEDLRTGRVDAVLLSHGFSRQLQDSGTYPDFNYLLVPEYIYINKAGPIFHTEELRDQYNEWFIGLAADGTWQEIVDRWIGVPLFESEDMIN